MNKRITDELKRLLNGPNEKRIIRYIIRNEEVSRTEISKALSVSMSTVTNVTEKLLRKDLIRECGVQKLERGRSIKLLQINEERFKSIGVGINAICVSINLIDLRGKTYFNRKIALDKTSWKKNYENIITLIDQMAAENPEFINDILGIGIAPPGFIAFEMHNLDKKFDFEDDWNIDDIINLLEENYDFGATSESSFSCILSGESFFGKAKDFNNVIFVNVSSGGIGWAKIENKVLDRKVSKDYHSLGHHVININGPLCSCSQHGCVEMYTGRDALVNTYIELVSRDEEYNTLYSSKDALQQIDYHKVLELAETGDYNAVQSVSKAATILSTALVNVASLMHPDLFVLSGQVVRSSSLFFSIVQKITNVKLKTLTGNEVEITDRVVEVNTSSVGAATLVFEQIFLEGNTI